MIDTYVAIDLETTGISPASDRIIEIGAIKVVDGKEVEIFSSFVNPRMGIPERITDLTGIDFEMVKDSPTIDEIFPKLLEFIGDDALLGHNILFDFSFLKTAAVSLGYTFEKDGIDTLKLARKIFPQLESRKLTYLCEYLGIDPGHSHRAYDDARSAKILYEKMCEMSVQSENLDWQEDVDKLMPLEFGIKKKSPITPAQERYLNALIKAHNITLDVDIASLTKNDASRIIDNILSTHGKIK